MEEQWVCRLKAGYLDHPTGEGLLYEALTGWSLATVRLDDKNLS